MKRKEYSAGMVKLSFWFAEFRKVIELLSSGKTLSEIKQMNIQENIFSAPTQARAIQILNTVSTRVKGLDHSFYAVFEKSDISTQKLIALIAVMQTDSLFFDFVYEVYREKLILGIDELADSDVGIFTGKIHCLAQSHGIAYPALCADSKTLLTDLLQSVL